MKIHKMTALVLCLCLLCLCVPVASAAGLIQTDKDVSLSISSRFDDAPLVGASFSLYRIAEVDERGELIPLPEYSVFDLEIRGKQDATWLAVTAALEAYILDKEIAPDTTGITDETGLLIFPDASRELEKGLYLVRGDAHKQGKETYVSTPFLVMLPTMDPVENIWVYDVCVNAKHTMLPRETVSYAVEKLWDDAGHENARPNYITVSLLQNGEIYDTVNLYAPNWSYTWDDLDPESVWTVSEHKVTGYTPQIGQDENTFVITNRYTPELPKTGQLDWPVPVMAVLGLMIFAAGWALRRSGKKERYEN